MMAGEVLSLPDFVVENLVGLRGLGGKAVEVMSELIHSHLADSLSITTSHIHATVSSLLFTSHQDVVPLVELGIPDLLVELCVGSVHVYFEASSVEVEHHAVAVLEVLLGNGNDDCLPWRNEEGPLACQVLNEDCNESLDRSKNGSVDDNWTGET